MKPFKKVILLSLALSSTLTANSAFASDSVSHASKASKHSVLAVSHGLASTAKVASAAVAVPLLVVGSVGVVSGAAGSTLMTSAINHNEPLTITEITITADPSPKAQMKSKTRDNSINKEQK